jgi:hypothetical protein
MPASALAAWQLDYNTIRPHSSLGNLPPADYATLSSPASQRGGSLRVFGDYAPRPVAASSLAAQMANRLYSSLDERTGSGHKRSLAILEKAPLRRVQGINHRGEQTEVVGTNSALPKVRFGADSAVPDAEAQRPVSDSKAARCGR